jgi:hypothetical protein
VVFDVGRRGAGPAQPEGGCVTLQAHLPRKVPAGSQADDGLPVYRPGYARRDDTLTHHRAPEAPS